MRKKKIPENISTLKPFDPTQVYYTLTGLTFSKLEKYYSSRFNNSNTIDLKTRIIKNEVSEEEMDILKDIYDNVISYDSDLINNYGRGLPLTIDDLPIATDLSFLDNTLSKEEILATLSKAPQKQLIKDEKIRGFNTIKVIKLINKDSLLQKVYANTAGKFEFDKLIELAKASTLTDLRETTLKDIYESFILISDTHKTMYGRIEQSSKEVQLMLSKRNKIAFNTIKVIKLIHKDSLLKKVYGNNAGKFEFRKLIQSAKDGTLEDEQEAALKDIYESIILVSDTHKTMYSALKEVRRKIPLRYGKKQLEADIKKQGGVPTIQQETLLLTAELETLKNTVNYRCIQDHYKGTNKISDDDHKKLQKAIRSFNNTLKDIL